MDTDHLIGFVQKSDPKGGGGTLGTNNRSATHLDLYDKCKKTELK